MISCTNKGQRSSIQLKVLTFHTNVNNKKGRFLILTYQWVLFRKHFCIRAFSQEYQRDSHFIPGCNSSGYFFGDVKILKSFLILRHH